MKRPLNGQSHCDLVANLKVAQGQAVEHQPELLCVRGHDGANGRREVNVLRIAFPRHGEHVQKRKLGARTALGPAKLRTCSSAAPRTLRSSRYAKLSLRTHVFFNPTLAGACMRVRMCFVSAPLVLKLTYTEGDMSKRNLLHNKQYENRAKHALLSTVLSVKTGESIVSSGRHTVIAYQSPEETLDNAYLPSPHAKYEFMEPPIYECR